MDTWTVSRFKIKIGRTQGRGVAGRAKVPGLGDWCMPCKSWQSSTAKIGALAMDKYHGCFDAVLNVLVVILLIYKKITTTVLVCLAISLLSWRLSFQANDDNKATNLKAMTAAE